MSSNAFSRVFSATSEEDVAEKGSEKAFVRPKYAFSDRFSANFDPRDAFSRPFSASTQPHLAENTPEKAFKRFLCRLILWSPAGQVALFILQEAHS